MLLTPRFKMSHPVLHPLFPICSLSLNVALMNKASTGTTLLSCSTSLVCASVSGSAAVHRLSTPGSPIAQGPSLPTTTHLSLPSFSDSLQVHRSSRRGSHHELPLLFLLVMNLHSSFSLGFTLLPAFITGSCHIRCFNLIH